ncbi:MAG: DUF2070 family protein [Candidatus Thermoplasmatota archaeon]|nr:DUF2070 family protein [Candidatus Thermoplasmatota archaeon]
MSDLEKTTKLIKYIFRAPNPKFSVLGILIFSSLATLLLFPELNNLLKLYYFTVIFLLPSILSGLISKPLADVLKGELYFRRAYLISLISLAILTTITITIKILTQELVVGLIIGYSSIIWFRHVVLVSISNSSHLRSLPASLSQSLLGLFALHLVFEFTAREFTIAISNIIIFLVSAFSFIELAKLKFKKAYNVNALDLLKATIAHFTNNSLALERFFEAGKEELEAALNVLCFRSAKNKKLKAVVIVPENVHPGPFGKLCGSDLPAKLEVQQLDCPLFVFHSCSTHDYNPATSNECFKIATALKETISKASDYSSLCSKYIVGSSGNVTVSAQYFNDCLLLICSFEKPVDDIEPSVASRLTSVLNDKRAVVVDSHSSVAQNAATLELDSELLPELIDAAQKVYLEAKCKEDKLRLGVALRYVDTAELGASGIRALVVEAGGQKTGYVVFDGNGMLIGVRAKLKASVLETGLLDALELLTTDNHAVNLTMHGFNPVGSSVIDYTNVIKDVIQEAVSDLEAAEVASAKKAVEINVAGRGSTSKLTSTINSTISIVKILFPFTMIVTGLALCLVMACL